MSYVITLDTGTTNTRVTLWRQQRFLDRVSCEVGVRNTAIEGSNEKLKSGVKACLDTLLARNALKPHQIDRILASGMITSNVGLVEIPHLWAGAGKEELAAAMVSHRLPEIIDQEIWFIPGIKNRVEQVTLENCEEMDIMRGEEVETVGLLERYRIQEPALIILPGSHTKFVSCDGAGRITGCMTSLTGELLSVISQHTIIANALRHTLPHSFSKEMVLKGWRDGHRVGINRSIFTVRILDQFTDQSVNEKANYLLGVLLAGDMQAIKNSSALKADPQMKVIIAGKTILQEAFQAIIKEDGYFQQVLAAEESLSENLSGFGALCIGALRWKSC